MKKLEKTSTRETVIGTVKYLNTVTNQIEEFSVIDKNITTDMNFHKIWLQDVLNILDSFGNKKILVITYLLKIMRNEDNTFSGSLREISEQCQISLPTVNLVVKELIETNIIKKIALGTYQFNPDIIVKGSSNKRKNLLIRYNTDDYKKEVPNSKLIEGDSMNEFFKQQIEEN